MPKNLFQEIIFTIIMVIVMVYAMICYNIALSTGGMSNFVFLAAFKELAIMGPIAFVLDFFLVGKIAKAKAFKNAIRQAIAYSNTPITSELEDALAVAAESKKAEEKQA